MKTQLLCTFAKKDNITKNIKPKIKYVKENWDHKKHTKHERDKNSNSPIFK